jgi:UDP-N-acetylmuramyl pentapeptide synthase
VATDDNLLLNALTSVASALLRIRRSQRRAVIEVGINLRGQMERYARMIRPDIVVATSVGGEHEIEIGAFEDIRNEKSRMVRALRPSGVAVLNGDDPNVMWMAGQTGARIVTYGFGASCDVRASDLRLDWPHGSRVRVVAFGDEREVAVRLIGRHLIYPVLAAIAVAHVEGLDLDATLASLQSLSPTPVGCSPSRSRAASSC